MIYATSTLTEDFIAKGENPEKITRELHQLASQRGAVEREIARGRPGVIGPAERIGNSYGDAILVMVDAGLGEDIRKEIEEKVLKGH